METLGHKSEPLPSEKLRAVICNLKEERSNILYMNCSMRMISPRFYQNS